MQSTFPPNSIITRPPFLSIIGVLLLVTDIVTKWATAHFLGAGPPHEIVLARVLGITVSLSYTINTGAAWGILSSAPYLLVAIRIFFIVALAIFLIFYSAPTVFRLPLTLILCGALGNVIDFFLYGHVIDMIHCVFWGYDYPVFNVADMTICVGVALIFIFSFFHQRSP